MPDPAAHPPALCVDQLTVLAGGSTLLDGVSFEVPPGGRLAVVGRSGAGKTTLLSAIAGLTPLAGGAIHVGGKACAEDGSQRMAPAERGVGLVFQDLGLWDHLSVVESIAFAGRGDRRQRKVRAEELADRVGLGGRLGAFPGALSGGEQQRLALARALASEPKLLLLDEPFAHLDPPLRRALGALVLEHVQQLGVGLVVASHTLEDVLRLSESLCVLEGGRVLEVGPVAACLAEPQSEELVRLFDLGSVLAGTLTGGRFRCELGEAECSGPEGPARAWLPPEGVVAREGGTAITVVGPTPSNGRTVCELRTAGGQRLLSTLTADTGSSVEVAIEGPLRLLGKSG